MRLTYFFETKQDAEDFFLKTVPLYTGDTEGLEVDCEEWSITLDELSDICVMCSWSVNESGIYAYIDLDGDAMKVADQIKDLIDKIVAPENIKYSDCHTGNRLGVVANDQEAENLKLCWPEKWEPTPELSNEYKFTYHIYAALPSESEGFVGKLLSAFQQTKLLQHWLGYAGLQISDLDMYAWSDGGDGNYTPKDIETILTSIYGNGLEQCGYIRIAESWGDESGKELYLKRLILDLLTPDMEVDEVCDTSYVGAGNGFKIVSDAGSYLQVNLKRKLTEVEQAAFVKRYESSDIYRFIHSAFVHLFGKPPIVFIHDDSGESLSLEEPDDFEGGVVTLTDALKKGSYKMSAVKVNKELVRIGVLKELKVRGVKSSKKVFSEENSPYGENIPKSHRKNDIEARYYTGTFRALMHRLDEEPVLVSE